jgi:hypothetical protein
MSWKKPASSGLFGNNPNVGAESKRFSTSRPEVAKISAERFVNLSVLKELDDKGFIDRLYQ